MKCAGIKYLVWVLLTSLTHRVACHYIPNLKLNFLCSAVESAAYVRDVPWDCSSYIICMNGQALPTVCPQGKLYASPEINSKCERADLVDARRCHHRVWDYLGPICQANPTARVPDASRCGQYLDCGVRYPSPDFVDYLQECPYPDLFSTETGACENYRYVVCGERREPKAPCDYLQYLQMYDCSGPTCVTCVRHHPSCVHLTNGPQPVPLRNDIIMECEGGRTVNIIPASTATTSVLASAAPTALSTPHQTPVHVSMRRTSSAIPLSRPVSPIAHMSLP